MALENACEVCVDSNTLCFRGGGKVTFEHPIEDVVGYGDMVVVLIMAPLGVVYNDNVFGVARDGRIVWRVPHFDWLRGDSPYTAIQRDITGRLMRLWNFRCINIFLDPMTGRFIRKEISR